MARFALAALRGDSPAAAERATVQVLVRYEDLVDDNIRAWAGEDARTGLPLSGDAVRRLCCDAELLPAVLGAPSEVLDVGRSRRLVTPEIRTALVLRDGCCAFPGCDVAAELCEAHHVVPWWAGGSTALSNLVLLCHSHHGIVEPARHATREQWELRIGDDGVPEFLPPRRLDSSRAPIRGSRHGPALARAG